MITLYCYSATGNTLRVAQTIARTLGDARIVPFDPAMKPDGDVVGFLFPVYFWTVPRLVSEFFETFTPNPDVYYFAVATYGGMELNALRDAAAALSARGAVLSYAAAVKSVANDIAAYDIGVKTIPQRLAAADGKAEKIARDIAARAEKRVGKPLSFAAKLAKYPPRNCDEAFSADEARCAKCGLCVSVCPRGNIERKEGLPLWMGNCDLCLSCIHWCPSRAIEYGGKTAKRHRYRHPEISREELPR